MDIQFYWDLRRVPAADRQNANRLSVAGGVTYPVATRVLRDWTEKRALQRLDLATVRALALHFKVDPWTLLRVVRT